ncbi:MAG TPA: histidine kinase, partial [Longimicrobium sp.]|nr:histidine kinase [Longimicrobium sp.]
AARASVSATFWAGACLLAFRVGHARRWALAPACAAATLGVWLLFAAQQSLYCRLGWGGCSQRLAPALAGAPLSLLMATSMVAFGRAYAGAARHREDEIRADRLGADLAGARLDALAGQLRPHFLFNTLQSVATLLHRDPAGAREMLAGLRTLLERSTRASGAGELPLDEELELLALYTGIERVRFGDRLRVEVAVAPGAGRALVPHLLLQPLVENAVRHAVARRGAGTIRVRAEAGDGWLGLEVGDNGEGLAPGRREDGVGLENTRARLRALYGARHAMELESRPGEGLTVRIRIPLRRAGEGRGEG